MNDFLIHRYCSNCFYWQQSGPSPPGVIQQMCTSESSVNKAKFTTGGQKCSEWAKIMYDPMFDKLYSLKPRL